jgi:phosphoglycolate phosphatase
VLYIKYKYVVFDFDGVIADSFKIYTDCINKEISSYFNINTTFEDISLLLRNSNKHDLIKKYVKSKFKILSIILKIRWKILRKYKDVKIFTGIKEILNELKNNGYHLILLSSNWKINIKPITDKYNITNLFEYTFYGANSLDKKKCLENMLKKLKINKKEIIYIGDEVTDIIACKKIGCPIMAVSWGFNCEKYLQNYNPIFIAKTPLDIINFIINNPNTISNNKNKLNIQ